MQGYLVHLFTVPFMMMLFVRNQSSGIERHPIIDLSRQITIIYSMPTVTESTMLK